MSLSSLIAFSSSGLCMVVLTSGKIQADINSQESNRAAVLGTETIRMRAYEFFLKRGATHGDDLADWFRAEEELRTASSF